MQIGVSVNVDKDFSAHCVDQKFNTRYLQSFNEYKKLKTNTTQALLHLTVNKIVSYFIF